jgi:toxic protein SymE
VGEAAMNYQNDELMQFFSMLDLHSRADRSNLDNMLDEIFYPEKCFSLIKKYGLEMKTHRRLKVCAQSGYNYQAVPAIRLQGKWLENLGFSVGQEINVQCEKGCLIIRLEDEPSNAR